MTDCLELIKGTQLSRRHALKIFAAASGGVLASRFASVAYAEKTYEEILPEATLIAPEGTPLKLGDSEPYCKMDRQGDPTLIMEPGNKRLWTTWIGEPEGKKGIEGVQIRSFSLETNTWGEPMTLVTPEVPEKGCCFQSEIAVLGDKLLILWTEYLGKAGWGIRARLFDPESRKPGPIVRIMGEAGRKEMHWYPALASNGKDALAVWQAEATTKGKYDIFGQWFSQNGTQAGQPFAIATGEACRPAVAVSPNGRIFSVAWDKQDAPGNQNIYAAFLQPGDREASQPIRISSHPASDLAPALAFSKDGEQVWVSWHSNRKDADLWDLPKWYELRAIRVADGAIMEPVGKRDGYDPELKGTIQGYELTRLAVSPEGAVCVLGRPSQSFYIQYFSGKKNAPLYRLPKDGWGGRGRFLRGVFDEKGNLWTTGRHLGTNLMAQVEGFSNGLQSPEMIPHGSLPNAKLKNISKTYKWDDVKLVGKEGMEGETLQLMLGDVHNHSWQSDGMGDPEEIYLRNRDVYRDDFTVVTDHTRFVRKRLMDAEWEQQKALAEHYHKDDEFVTIFGQEWTTARTNRGGFGHFNIYSDDPTIPLVDTRNPTKKLQGMYEVARKHNALAWPHHIGWTGVPWGELDLAITPCVEIVSGHGAFEYYDNHPIEPRGDIKGCFAQDGLKLGLKFGILGGSDQHGLLWHHGICWKRDSFRSGITGVWAQGKTRKHWIDAIRKRRTFATSGVKMSMKFWIDDHFMGDEIKTTAAPHLMASIDLPPDQGKLKVLEVIRNNEPVLRLEGDKAANLDWTDKDCPAGGKANWYYLRLILKGDPVNMAWSSPIWVTRV